MHRHVGQRIYTEYQHPKLTTPQPADTLRKSTLTANVAQLVRAPDCGSGGRGFESPHSPYDAPASCPSGNEGADAAVFFAHSIPHYGHRSLVDGPFA